MLCTLAVCVAILEEGCNIARYNLCRQVSACGMYTQCFYSMLFMRGYDAAHGHREPCIIALSSCFMHNARYTHMYIDYVIRHGLVCRG